MRKKKRTNEKTKKEKREETKRKREGKEETMLTSSCSSWNSALRSTDKLKLWQDEITEVPVVWVLFSWVCLKLISIQIPTERDWPADEPDEDLAYKIAVISLLSFYKFYKRHINSTMLTKARRLGEGAHWKSLSHRNVKSGLPVLDPKCHCRNITLWCLQYNSLVYLS